MSHFVDGRIWTAADKSQSTNQWLLICLLMLAM